MIRTISQSMVEEYIEKAESDAYGGFGIEAAAVAEARFLGGFSSGRVNVGYTGYTQGISGDAGNPSTREALDVWKAAILKEIRKALCAANSGYRKDIAELASNGRMLIGAIAGYVAASLGVAVAVVAALVAALLRLVLMIGVRAFCEATKPEFD